MSDIFYRTPLNVNALKNVVATLPPDVITDISHKYGVDTVEKTIAKRLLSTLYIPDYAPPSRIKPFETNGTVDCSICFQENRKRARLNCGHAYICADCVRKQIYFGNLCCPYCRRNIYSRTDDVSAAHSS